MCVCVCVCIDIYRSVSTTTFTLISLWQAASSLSGSSEGINYKYTIELTAIEQLVNLERVFWHDKVKAIFKVY